MNKCLNGCFLRRRFLLLLLGSFVQRLHKRSKQALNRSSEFKGVIVQIVCDVEIQFEFAWALANITSGTT